MARKLGAGKALRALALLRPDTPVDVVRIQLAHEHVADIEALDMKIKAVGRQIGELVTASGTHLTDLCGVGPVIAGRILAEVENINRFTSRHHFASYNGTAPIDASSGEQVRHRLSRAGNRRLNHALHMMALTQISRYAREARVEVEPAPGPAEDRTTDFSCTSCARTRRSPRHRQWPSRCGRWAD